MKNIKRFILFITTITIASLPFNHLKADWYEFENYNQVLAVSKIAKVGKISVFIVSTKWCNPCYVLKDQLKHTNLDMDLVDIYYFTMAENQGKMQRRRSYEIWRGVEQLDAWPYIYITGPTSNIVSNFSALKESNPFERITRVISLLEDQARNFPNEIMITQAPKNSKNLPLPIAAREMNNIQNQIHDQRNNSDYIKQEIEFDTWYHSMGKSKFARKKGKSFLRIEFLTQEEIMLNKNETNQEYYISIPNTDTDFNQRSIQTFEQNNKGFFSIAKYNDPKTGNMILILKIKDPQKSLPLCEVNLDQKNKKVVDFYVSKQIH